MCTADESKEMRYWPVSHMSWFKLNEPNFVSHGGRVNVANATYFI